jgi:hypothetical protein
VLSPTLLNSLISLLYLNLSIGLKLSNVSTTKFFVLLTKLLTLIVLPIYALFSLFKIFEILVLPPLSLWFILPTLHVLKSLIGLSFIWLLFSGIVCLLIFVLALNVLQKILLHLLLFLLFLLLNSMLNSNIISSIILFLLNFFLFCWTDPSGS